MVRRSLLCLYLFLVFSSLSLSVALCVCVSSPSCTAEGMCDNSIVRLVSELTKLEGRWWWWWWWVMLLHVGIGVFVGIGDECKNHGLYEFTQLLINTSGAVGFCMYVVVLFSCPVHLRCIFSLMRWFFFFCGALGHVHFSFTRFLPSLFFSPSSSCAFSSKAAHEQGGAAAAEGCQSCVLLFLLISHILILFLFQWDWWWSRWFIFHAPWQAGRWSWSAIIFLPPLLEAWESINCNFYWFFWKTQKNCKISVKKDASFFQNLASLWSGNMIALLGLVGWGAGRLGLWSGIVFNLWVLSLSFLGYLSVLSFFFEVFYIIIVVAWEKKLKEERIKWMLFMILGNGIEISLTTYYRSKRYQSCNLGTILLAYPRYILCL